LFGTIFIDGGGRGLEFLGSCLVYGLHRICLYYSPRGFLAASLHPPYRDLAPCFPSDLLSPMGSKAGNVPRFFFFPLPRSLTTPLLKTFPIRLPHPLSPPWMSFKNRTRFGTASIPPVLNPRLKDPPRSPCLNSSWPA